ncbi:radical SAM protein [Methanospirillum stamsii]|uniref:radical SAM protein n=1 Tax=Methanospirillum stamsii TaxID=1277351 RepID=UPI0015E848C6|nr:radical SAM protein [Methanospirillum stamsii]
MEVTTRCGLRCIMCEHTYWEEPSRDISYQEFVSIIDQFPKLKWIGLTGIGESFLNKDFMKMLELVKSRGIYVELYDNLFFPNEGNIKKLVDLQVDKLLISCEAATPELYEQIRPGASFETVMNHIKLLFDYKKEKKSEYPKISFHYIVMKNNLEEIPHFISSVSELAQEPVSIQITRMLHYFPEVQDLYTDISEDYIQSCETLAKENNVHISWNLDVSIEKPPISQCIEWTMPFIFANGDVVPCCSANESNKREYQKKTSMGNIFETSFKEIWNGVRYQDLRKKLRQGSCPPACIDCCLYNYKRK